MPFLNLGSSSRSSSSSRAASDKPDKSDKSEKPEKSSKSDKSKSSLSLASTLSLSSLSKGKNKEAPSPGYNHLSPTSSASSQRHMAPSPKVLAALGASISNGMHSPRLEGIAHYHNHHNNHHHSSHVPAAAAPVEPPVKLSFKIESPPLVMFGLAKESTGSLLNGLFILDVTTLPSIKMKSVYMVIVQVIKYKRPVANSCKNCTSRTSELARWDVLDHVSTLVEKSHVYPFSHLLPGSIPATSNCGLFNISYRLEAYAYPEPSSGFTTPFILKHKLQVGRSIIRTNERHSVRVFPPTDLTCNITLPPTIYPKSTFSIGMILQGVTSTDKGTRWRMRKMNWRIDETIKTKLYACQNHLNRLTPVVGEIDGGAMKQRAAYQHNNRHRRDSSSMIAQRDGVQETAQDNIQDNIQDGAQGTAQGTAQETAQEAAQETAQETAVSEVSTPTTNPDRLVAKKPEQNTIEETRTVGSGEIRKGWKTDFSDKGKVELFGEISTHNFSDVSCNLDDPQLDISVSHVLVVELVVAEETSNNKPKSIPVPTGSARVLRMQFNLMVTQRSGLGIAWDDEVPPTYEDIPLSPPDYDIVGELPKFEEIVQLALMSPGGSSSSVVGSNNLTGINSQLLFSPLVTPSESLSSSTTSSTTNLSGLMGNLSIPQNNSQISLDNMLNVNTANSHSNLR